MTDNVSRLRRVLKSTLDNKQNRITGDDALLGDGYGLVATGDPNMVYARVAGGVVARVYNDRVPLLHDLPVKIGFDPLHPARLRVLDHGEAPMSGQESADYINVGNHAPTHRYPLGRDINWVELRQFMPLRLTPIPGTLTVHLYPGVVKLPGGAYQEITGAVYDLTAYVPTTSGKARYTLVSISDAGAVTFTAGAEVDIAALDATTVPAAPADTAFELGMVRTYYGQTEIIEAASDTDIWDLRFPMPHTHGAAGVSLALDDLTDVEITSPVDGEVLAYNGSEWVNQSTGPITYLEASLSSPPTNAEMTALIGDPSDASGKAYVIKDILTSRWYLVFSTGLVFLIATLTTLELSVPPTPTPGDPNLPGNAVWCWFSDPRAVYYNGQTYVGFLTSAGYAMVAAYDHSASVFSDPVFVRNVQIDDHANPSILIRDSDKRLMAFYSAHNGSGFYYKVSTNPEDISAWGAEVNLHSVLLRDGYTYTVPVQLTGEANSPIYLFYRYNYGTDKRWGFTKSTNGGTTWAAHTALFYVNKVTYDFPYMKLAQNGTGRIDFIVTDGEPWSTYKPSVYHFYYSGGSWYASDGTSIGSPPFTDASATQIYDGTTYGVVVIDVAIDGSGNPVALLEQYRSSSDRRYLYARWDGSAWTVTEIAADGGNYATGYAGGGSIDGGDVNNVYLSRLVSGEYEIYKYVTADSGATWTPTALTTGSAGKNLRPFVPRSRQNDLKVLWLYGTYNTFTNYSMSLKMSDQ